MDSPFLQFRWPLFLLFLLIALACAAMLWLSRRYQDSALRRRVIFLATLTILVLASDHSHGLLVTCLVVVGLVTGITLLIYRRDNR